ncbi:MAG: sigma-70 family RNA polymerase sigma factor [Gemmatimonadales bacterium]
MTESREVTTLLHQWRGGDDLALERMIPLVYDELRSIASKLMRGERPDHTLQATALVHEAYARLIGAEVEWQDRNHFFAIAARQMRRILVDHAKSKGRIKRGGDVRHVTLESAAMVQADPSTGIVEIDEALNRLAEQDPRKAKVVELHFFGGLTYEETASVLGISPATVDRDLRFAKAWLYRELENERQSE